jgi:hypothetical protein
MRPARPTIAELQEILRQPIGDSIPVTQPEAAVAVVVIDGIDVQDGYSSVETSLEKRVYLAVPGGAQSDRRPLTQAEVIASIRSVTGYSDESWHALPALEKKERIDCEVDYLRNHAAANSRRAADAAAVGVGAESLGQAGTALAQSTAGIGEGSALPQIVLGAEGQGESATAAQINKASGAQEA